MAGLENPGGASLGYSAGAQGGVREVGADDNELPTFAQKGEKAGGIHACSSSVTTRSSPPVRSASRCVLLPVRLADSLHEQVDDRFDALGRGRAGRSVADEQPVVDRIGEQRPHEHA
jgi:hypothetical protein